MKPARCRLCCHAHVGLDHIWSDEVANIDEVANKPLHAVANRSKDRHKDKARRREYMRELMRRKREYAPN